MPTTQVAKPHFGGIFDYDAKSERLHVVNAELEDPAVWNDPKHAQDLGREKKNIETVVTTLTELAQSIADSRELFELAAADGDDAVGEFALGDLAILVLDFGGDAAGAGLQ